MNQHDILYLATLIGFALYTGIQNRVNKKVTRELKEQAAFNDNVIEALKDAEVIRHKLMARCNEHDDFQKLVYQHMEWERGNRLAILARLVTLENFHEAAKDYITLATDNTKVWRQSTADFSKELDRFVGNMKEFNGVLSALQKRVSELEAKQHN